MPDLFRKIDAMPVGVCVCVCVVLVCGLERLYVGIQVRGCLCMFVGVCAGVDGWVSLSLCLPHKHTNSLELSPQHLLCPQCPDHSVSSSVTATRSSCGCGHDTF